MNKPKCDFCPFIESGSSCPRTEGEDEKICEYAKKYMSWHERKIGQLKDTIKMEER